MMVETPDYRRSPVPVRDDLAAAHRRAWARLAAPGEWWTGVVRLAIAEETRAATDCRLCRDRKEALSPYAVTGTHTAATDLPDTLIDVIHRALSLVPAEVTGFFDLDTVHYLPDAVLRDYGNEYRALTHAQIEFLAARVSAINQCFY